jgi:hypothetical protein
MKTYSTKIMLATLMLAAGLSAKAQDALMMQDINFGEAGYNTAFMAEKDSPLSISLTNTTGGGIQNIGQINFLGYAHLEKAGMALGVRVNSKYYGLFRTSMVEMQTAKRIQLNGNSSLYAGIGIGMQFNSLRTSELNNYVDRQDPMLMDNAFPQYRFAFGFGLGYSYRDKLKAGFSMPSLARTESAFYPLYIANLSYNLSPSQTFGLRPELLLFGSDIAPVSGELSARVDFKKQFWIKMGGRSTRAFVGGIGVDTPFISVGYAYNAFIQEFQTIVPATHHINLSFRVVKEGEGKGKKFQLW